MKTVVVGGLLVGSNALWFSMLRTIRKSGYRVSYLNSLQDLRSYRELILRTEVPSVRLRLSVALAALYLSLTALTLSLAL